MTKSSRKTIWLLAVWIFLIGSGLVFAQSAPLVTVKSGETIAGDKFAGGQIINNEGTINGDLFFWGQTITSKGIIAGDAIGIGQDVNLSGDIQGNVRAGGGTITLSNRIGKNVNVFAGVINLTGDSAIGGNLIAFGSQINAGGKVKGSTLIGGGNITLSGEFFGDVNINNFGIDNSKEWNDGNASLKVLPGSIIHGKLKFRGGSADIQKGAQVAGFQWVKSKITPKETQVREINRYIWKFVRLIFTTAVYFLLGLLLLKLFPAIFVKMADFSTRKPWNAIGYGLIALVCIFAALVAFIILLVMSLIMSPAFGLIFAITATAFYCALFFLAAIPAALWLGGLVGKEKWNTAYRLATGLIILNVGLFILEVLGKVPVAGPVFPALAFIVRFGAVILGSGVLMHGIYQVYLAAKKD